MVAHARDDAPNECCGMVAADNGRAVEVYPAANAAASPLRYEIDPSDLYRLTSAIDDAGWALGAIYHSHTRSAPYPSQTDINLAFAPGTDQPLWPGAVYIIVGVASAEPAVRAFSIPARDRVEELELEVD
jgi:[CysO sulfur-carrier protein]-S-L-cysteine hydrolase